MLFESINIKNLKSRNRIILSPMAMYSAKNGLPNEFHFVHYGSRALGGVGIIILEATAIEKKGMITPSDLGLYNKTQMRALSKIVRFIKKFDAIPGIQIAHAGRKAGTYVPCEGFGRIPISEGGWIPVAPSPIPYVEDWIRPKELTQENIINIQRKFVKSAILAVESGFKILEIHAAHGYLIHEFLSPLTNKRKDKYGGNLENRIRFLIEIIQKIKEKIPNDIPLFVRISGVDFIENGWNLNDTIFLAKEMKENGVDLIDCSSGGILPNIRIPDEEGYNVFISEKIKRNVNIMTSVVGNIYNKKTAEKILSEGKADMITMGRLLLRDPFWPAREGAKEKKEFYPVQYKRGFQNLEI